MLPRGRPVRAHRWIGVVETPSSSTNALMPGLSLQGAPRRIGMAFQPGYIALMGFEAPGELIRG
jgi:hypothetical protein